MKSPSNFKNNSVRRDAPPQENENKLKINNEIRSYKVRLIDQTGTNHGVVSINDALLKAREVQLDLVEVSPEANPPVCKIMDFGKYIFEQKKKQKENVHKAPEPREIRLSPSIGQGDLEIKAKKALEFLNEGSKVTLSFKLRGREAKKIVLVEEVVNRFFLLVQDVSTLEKKGGIFALIPKIQK